MLASITMAWNLGLQPPETRLTTLERAVPGMADLDDVLRHAFIDQIEILIAKKLDIF